MFITMKRLGQQLQKHQGLKEFIFSILKTDWYQFEDLGNKYYK
jgi:hypothetical protein